MPRLVGELKRAAIDAYMKSHAWLPAGDHYMPKHPVDWGAPYTSVEVTRPKKDGTGGGRFTALTEGAPGTEDSRYVGAFNSVRSWVDSTVELLVRIPDGSSYDGPYQQLAGFFLYLPRPGKAGVNLQFLRNWAWLREALDHDRMRGQFVEAFDAYIDALPGVVANFSGMVLALMAGLKAEQVLMRNAREDAVRIVESAIASFNECVAVGESSYEKAWDKGFAVTSTIASAISLLVPGGIGFSITAGTIAITLADSAPKLADYAFPPAPGLVFDDVRKATAQAVSSLLLVIEEVEKGMSLVQKDNRIKVLGNEKQKPFDLDSGLRHARRPADFQLNPAISEDAVGVVLGALDGIGDVLRKARARLLCTEYYSAWWRPIGLGMGSYGFRQDWLGLLSDVDKRLDDLREEVVDARARFDLGARALIQQDCDIAKQLQEYADNYVDPYPNLL
jgi:hypothetical protein